MTREEARREIDDLDYYLQHHTDDYSESSHTAMMMAISALEQSDYEKTVYAAFSQVKKERDIAIEQLKELGYELGQKIEPCETSTDEPMIMVYPTIFCDDAVSQLNKIRQIIAIPNSVIQEDVMKYKMICEVMNDDKSVS